MSKSKKKRNKAYTGRDAAITKPSLTRINAVNRNKAHQWWYDNKRLAKPLLLIAAILVGIVLIIIGVISLLV